MKLKSRLYRFALLLTASMLSLGAAEQPSAAAPSGDRTPSPFEKTVRYTQDFVKLGSEREHAEVMEDRIRTLRAVRWPRNTIGLRSIRQPDEVLFLTGYDKLSVWGDADPAAIEANPALKNDLGQLEMHEESLLSSSRDVSYRFIRNLSYRPDTPNLQKARWYLMVIYKIKEGYKEIFNGQMRLMIETHAANKVNESVLTFRSVDNDFMVIIPHTSLASWESITADRPNMVTPERLELLRACVESESRAMYKVDPSISYVTGAWAGEDHEFWLQDAPAMLRKPQPKLSGFPEAVQPLIKKAIEGVDDYDLEDKTAADDGEIRYAVTTYKNGFKQEYVYNAAGNLQVFERNVPFDQMPQAVQNAVKSGMNGGKLLFMDQLDIKGQPTYKATFFRSYMFNADGTTATPFKPTGAKEVSIEEKDLPLGVLTAINAVRAQYKNTVTTKLLVRSGDQPLFEFGVTTHGVPRQVVFDADGKIVVVEEVVPIDAVPAAVRDAIQKNMGDGKLRKVERFTKNGVTTYSSNVGHTLKFFADGSPREVKKP